MHFSLVDQDAISSLLSNKEHENAKADCFPFFVDVSFIS